MKISIKDYRCNQKKVMGFYRKNGLDKTYEFCVLSAIPLIAMYAFINEETGEYSEKLAELLEFYMYEGYVD